MNRGPQSWFSDYIPLNTSRKRIYQKCTNAEFKNANVRRPKSHRKFVRETNQSNINFIEAANMTPKSVHLKDTLDKEILINKL